MLDNAQHKYGTTELDPDILSTPFGVQTNWHVITGAPCSGKTTLIDQLADCLFNAARPWDRRMTLLHVSSMSGSPAITAPWAIVS